MFPAISLTKSVLPWIVSLVVTAAVDAAVTPYVHYRMRDGSPATQGGNNLPSDASGNGRHITNAGPGTPVITNTGGPDDDAYYTFEGNNQYFYGTAAAAGWDPPENNVGVEAWVRTSNLTQTNKHRATGMWKAARRRRRKYSS